MKYEEERRRHHNFNLNGKVLRLFPDGEVRADEMYALSESERKEVAAEFKRHFGKKQPGTLEFRSGVRIKS